MSPLRLAAIASALLVPAGRGLAHDLRFTEVRLELREDATFRADVTCDLDALALGVDSGADSAELAATIAALPAAEREALEARLVDLLKRRLRVRFDGEPAAFGVSLPERGQPPPSGRLPSTLGLLARLEGPMPADAREVSFFASRGFPPVRLEIVRGGAPLHVEVLQQGAESAPVPVRVATETSRGQVFVRFLVLGFEHIVPAGLDHVLFVLGLALFSRRLGPLLVQVTAFTVAHTLTLILSTYGVVRLPSRLVEPLIALSITWVAVENVWRTQLGAFRVLLVFAFGLLHGLGFAGVLAELGLPARDRLTALFAFNAGVELGQLAVILPTFLTLAGLEHLGVPRRRIVVPASVAIGAVGLFWTVTRLMG